MYEDDDDSVEDDSMDSDDPTYDDDVEVYWFEDLNVLEFGMNQENNNCIPLRLRWIIDSSFLFSPAVAPSLWTLSLMTVVKHKLHKGPRNEELLPKTTQSYIEKMSMSKFHC